MAITRYSVLFLIMSLMILLGLPLIACTQVPPSPVIMTVTETVTQEMVPTPMFTTSLAAASQTPTQPKLFVTISPIGAGITSPSLGSFDKGTILTLSAMPYAGYGFVSWSGSGYSSTDSTIRVTFDSDIYLTAKFVLLPTTSVATDVATLVKKVAPAVVRVITDAGMGSGVIIDNQGSVLTNNHVIEGSRSIKVVFADKREYSASAVGIDEIKDLAVVKINASNLPVITLGKSEKLTQGDEVISIGYPLDLSGSATVSKGIVSAFRFDSESGLTYIQTDASINPGSSGGAIINGAGEVVGITVKTIRIAGGLPIEGMNFAIAIDSAKPVIAKLMGGQSVLKPWAKYTDSFRGFTIQYPSTWTLNAPSDPNTREAVAAFIGPDHVYSFVNVYSPDNRTVSSFANALLNKPQMQTLLNRELLWQGVYPANEITYLDSRYSEHAKGKMLIILINGESYWILAQAPELEFDSYSATIDTIISSFRLTAPNPTLASTPTPETLVTYTDEIYGYSFTYPNKLTLRIDRGDTKAVHQVVVHATESRYCVVSVEDPVQVQPGETLSSLVDNYYRLNSKYSLVWQVLSRTNITWQGLYPACEITYLSQGNADMPLNKNKSVFIVKNGYLYKIDALTAYINYDFYSSMIDTIVNSLRFPP